jgi:hypothetical protein
MWATRTKTSVPQANKHHLNDYTRLSVDYSGFSDLLGHGGFTFKMVGWPLTLCRRQRCGRLLPTLEIAKWYDNQVPPAPTVHHLPANSYQPTVRSPFVFGLAEIAGAS